MDYLGPYNPPMNPSPAFYNRIKVTHMTEHMIPIDAYGMYTIIHVKPHPFQRLRLPVTIKWGGAYAITVLCILIINIFILTSKCVALRS